MSERIRNLDEIYRMILKCLCFNYSLTYCGKIDIFGVEIEIWLVTNLSNLFFLDNDSLFLIVQKAL